MSTTLMSPLRMSLRTLQAARLRLRGSKKRRRVRSEGIPEKTQFRLFHYQAGERLLHPPTHLPRLNEIRALFNYGYLSYLHLYTRFIEFCDVFCVWQLAHRSKQVTFLFSLNSLFSATLYATFIRMHLRPAPHEKSSDCCLVYPVGDCWSQSGNRETRETRSENRKHGHLPIRSRGTHLGFVHFILRMRMQSIMKTSSLRNE